MGSLILHFRELTATVSSPLPAATAEHQAVREHPADGTGLGVVGINPSGALRRALRH